MKRSGMISNKMFETTAFNYLIENFRNNCCQLFDQKWLKRCFSIIWSKIFETTVLNYLIKNDQNDGFQLFDLKFSKRLFSIIWSKMFETTVLKYLMFDRKICAPVWQFPGTNDIILKKFSPRNWRKN
jgi:hypothetical protein